MKSRLRIFAIIFALPLVFPNLALADFDETSRQYFKEITFPQTIGAEYAYFQIDAEIYDGSFGMLRSLRIIDSDNREIPHQIVTKSKKEKREEFFPKLLNNSYLEGQYNSFVLDFGEERPEVNRLTIVTAGKNFTRRASVEGSNDQAKWNSLAEDAYIFDFSHNIQSKHLRIEFPLSNFRCIRVKIHDDGGGPLEIGGAKIYRVKTEPAETESWPLTIIERTENAKDRTTEVILDSGYRGLPLTKLDLKVSSRNYHRNVKVASSADRDEWAPLGSGVIFNYDMPAFKKTDNRISFRENTGGRYFKLTIENYDDRPVEVSGATGTGLVRRVILPAGKKAPYSVYFGNPKARAPRYDLAHRMRYIQTKTLPRLTLQPRRVNPSYVEPKPVKPWTEQHPSLLWIAMAAVIAILAMLIFNLMRKASPIKTKE